MPAIILGICVLAFSIGCSSHATVDGWQRGLERYADLNGNGDMSFLREPAEAGPPGEFAMLGGLSPDNSTDVSGRMLDRITYNGSDWIVFILASVDDRVIEDIRIALVSDVTGKRRWITSKENSASLQTYLAARRWSGMPANGPLLVGQFPPKADSFRVEAVGNTVSVIDERSNARWTVLMPDTKPSGAK